MEATELKNKGTFRKYSIIRRISDHVYEEENIYSGLRKK